MLGAPELGRGFAGLRHGLSAGEALPEAVRAAWTAATGRPIYEALGMSEVSTYVSFSPARPPVAGARRLSAAGRRVAVLAETGETPVPRGEDGLLAVSRRDPGLMLGYWRRPEETAAAFRGEWFVTGDRARMRADGAIVASRPGRRRDERRRLPGQPGRGRGGADGAPGVAEAAAVEMPVREGVAVDRGVLCAGARRRCRRRSSRRTAPARLARYKCPRVFRAVAALPRGPNGKLMRRKLREG